MSENLFINAPRALGDQIICNGLYRNVSQAYERCIIPVRKSLHLSMTEMLSDLTNVEFLVFPDRIARYSTYVSDYFFGKLGFDIIRIGYSGENFPSKSGVKWDENYYLQAGLDFKLRWLGFHAPRNTLREEELYQILGCEGEPYIFVHEDASRGFLIESSLLPKNMRQVRPRPDLKEFTIFDYRKVIESASTIHCIESSFTALIESMDINVPKYAHRYSRPEAKRDWWHEYTYASKWEVIN